MKLLITPTSPYARMAHIAVLEKQLPCEVQAVAVWDNDAAVLKHNPLRKIPILLTDDGAAVVDSRVICDYLEAQAPAPALLPSDAAGALAERTRAAIAVGAMDAGTMIAMSKRVAPAMADDAWRQWLMDKISGALAYFDSNAPRDGFHLSDIALGCLLGFLDFRMPDSGWQQRHARLAGHWQRLSARPSFQQTVPVA